MSLINDALKRARQAQRSNPTPPPDLQFRPADPSQRQSSSPPILLIVAVVVILVLVGAFAALVLQKWGAALPVAAGGTAVALESQTAAPSAELLDASLVPAAQSAPVTVQPDPAPTVEPAATPKLAALPETPATTASSLVPANSTDSTSNATVAAAVDPAPAQPAAPKLQGIFYRPQRPSAVINGKTVFVGSRVGDFQVLAITQERVTIGSATQTNVLSLGE